MPRQKIILALRSLSRRQWRLFITLALVGIAGLLWFVGGINQIFSLTVAAPGGNISEGIIGSPRFINPLLAISDADRDLSTLVYSGLMRINEKNVPEPDLAERVEVSEDGLTYTFTLKDDLTWHDGMPLTTADVEFTIASALNPIIKSIKRASWEGVRIERVDDKIIRFHLKQPYPPFLDNATMGILPKHIWGRLDPEVFALNQFNTEGVGSGPYKVKNIKKDSLGIPEYYDLVPFEDFALGEAKISNLRLFFYPNETELMNAYRRNEITSASLISAESAKALEALGSRVLRSPLPRTFGVFLNQNRAPVFANPEVRKALNLSLDRNMVIAAALSGYGQPVTGPLPNFSSITSTSSISEARAILENGGWQFDDTSDAWEKKTKKETLTLSFTLTTSDTPELKSAAEIIRDTWKQLGVKVDLKIFEIGDLNQNVIRPRQYEALFFGEILGRNMDAFAFWHSSQRLDPGLNIALYTNSVTDKILEEVRRSSDQDSISTLYQKFNDTVSSDIPAIFVYAPEFLYLLPNEIKNVTFPTINTAADRFLNIYRWYIKTDRVWPVFANKNNKI